MNRWRARAWNALGWVTMATGQGLYLAGLHLCGWAGTFDAHADDAELGWPRCRTCGYLHPARLGCPDPEVAL